MNISKLISRELLAVAAIGCGLLWAPQLAATTPCEDCQAKANYDWLKKPQTVTGILHSWTEDPVLMICTDSIRGTVTLKLAKFNEQKGFSKATMTVNWLTGKKSTASASLYDDGGQLYGTFNLRGIDRVVELYVWQDEEDGVIRFDAWCETQNGGYSAYSAKLGGQIDSSEFSLYNGEEMYSSLEEADFGEFDLFWDFLPEDRKITVKNGKTLDAGKVYNISYSRHNEDGYVYYDIALPTCGEECGTNYSGLKLTYAPKTGVLKGSFTMFLTNAGYVDESKKPTLKKLKVALNGFYISEENRAQLQASVKIGGKTFEWPVYLEPAEWCEDCEVCEDCY